MLEEAVHRLFADRVSQEAPDRQGAGWAPKLWQTLTDAGMHAISAPVDLGGSGGRLSDAGVVARATGRFAVPIPIVESSLLAGWLCEQAGRRLPDTGPATVGIADHRLTLRTDGERLVVDGSVHGVPWARAAGMLLVLAPGDGQATLVDVGPGACSVIPEENLAGEPRDTLVFKGTAVPAGMWAELPVTIDDALLRGALGRTLQMAGALEAILDLSVAYAGERCQFGRPIGRFQAVQHLLARLAGEAGIAVAASHGALRAVEAGGGAVEVAAAKVRAGVAAGRGAAIAHQVHGAFGMTQEASLHVFTRRLWAWRDEYGNEAEWAVRLATLVADRGGADALWPLLTEGSDAGSSTRQVGGAAAGLLDLAPTATQGNEVPQGVQGQ